MNIHIYTYTYMQVTTNENRGHEFEREQEGVYGRDQKVEREGRNDIILKIKERVKGKPMRTF